MLINLTKSLFVLLTILTIFLTSIGTAFAETVAINVSKNMIVMAQTTKITEINLTPQQRQQIQGIRQGRNRNIGSVLDSSQKAELFHNLRSGDNLEKAVDKVELQPEQREMVTAIQRLADLKIKAVISRD
ncbi:MAG: hypothetical protein KME64_39770 [Scytonematopsis contorta HA4267-MV1]|nr:hypothetical protein [Scytonematopsis contorta HA4267-MV1]